MIDPFVFPAGKLESILAGNRLSHSSVKEIQNQYTISNAKFKLGFDNAGLKVGSRRPEFCYVHRREDCVRHQCGVWGGSRFRDLFPGLGRGELVERMGPILDMRGRRWDGGIFVI
jgi:hypothetical protein